jgi:hypothetical protein
MTVDGDVILPPTCDPMPKGPRATLCTPAFRHLAHDRGASTATLVDEHEGTQGSTYIFGAVIDGSGECGSYAYWAMWVSGSSHPPAGVAPMRIAPPLEGCFILPPTIHWGPPHHLIVQSVGTPAKDYVLDEETYSFVAAK